MRKELYFLRSSEQKIVSDMFAFAHPNREELREKYTSFYGLTRKDLGLYVMVDAKVAGAIWSRRFDGDGVATLSLGILPEFENQDLERFMMEQFLQEAATHLDSLLVDITLHPHRRAFYESYGFLLRNDGIYVKELERKEIFRPSDGYDPTRWMD